MSRQLAEALAGLVFLLMGCTQMWLSLRLPNGIGLNAAEPGPGLFPMLVGGLMALSASLHLVMNLRGSGVEATRTHGAPTDISLLVLSIAAFILLLPRAGFSIAAFLLLLAVLTIYGMPVLWRRIATALVTTALSHLVFTKALGVNMPTASWFN